MGLHLEVKEMYMITTNLGDINMQKIAVRRENTEG